MQTPTPAPAQLAPASRPIYQPAPLRRSRRRSASATLVFGHAPILFAAFWLAAGIVVARWAWRPPSTLLFLACAALLLTGLAARRGTRIALLPLALVWLIAGQFSAEVMPRPAAAASFLRLSDGLQRRMIGTVLAIHSPRVQQRETTGGAMQQEVTEKIVISVNAVEDFTGDRDWMQATHGGLQLTLYARDPAALPALHCGEQITANVRMHPAERYGDPGAWDYRAYLAQHGIAALSSLPADALQPAGPPAPATLACLATAAQQWSSGRIHQVATAASAAGWLPPWARFNDRDAAMVSAMLFGDRAGLRHSVRSAFERTGSFHLLVVSGLHITIVIGLLFWLARTLRMSELWATILALSVALPYAFLTGFAPPVQRALLLSAVYLLGRLVYRERVALNAIGVAAVLILARDPVALFESSFQMTFLAVLVIGGVAAPLIERRIAPTLRALRLPRQVALDPHLPPSLAQLRVSLRMLATSLEPFLGVRWAWRVPFGATRSALRIAEAMIVAFLVELAMVLPMAVYFHRITVVALPANFLGLPLLGLLLPAALITYIAACVHPGMAILPSGVTAGLLHAISWLIAWFGRLPAAQLRTPEPAAVVVVFFLAAWGCSLFWVRRGGRHWLAALGLVGAASLAVLLPAPPHLHKGVLEITAIDVGQGDSILVVTPQGRTMLIDAGGPVGGPQPIDPQFDVGEDVVSQYLWSRGIRRLDAVALTHAHSDHMGGMPAVLRNFRPQALYTGRNPMTAHYRALLAVASQAGTRIRNLTAGDRFPFGGAWVHVLAPAADYQPGLRASNDDSLVLRIRFGDTAALLDGDAEAPVEREMAASEPISAELLKVGHHGSSTSTIPVFLNAVHPQFAVISVGMHNPFGHPKIAVLDALAADHVRVYRTDMLGLSPFLLDGKTVHPLPPGAY
jgi:competence protein ComEC